MATNPTSITTPGWGVSKTLGGDYAECIITDWECADETQVAYCQDQNGAVVHRQDYDKKTTVTATLMAPTTVTLPTFTAGKSDTLTVDSKVFAILSCREVQSNRDFRKLVFTLERYENWPTSAS